MFVDYWKRNKNEIKNKNKNYFHNDIINKKQ